MSTTDSEQLLVSAITARLGDPADWSSPSGYPDSLALCVLDAIWSMGVRYQSVERVLERYREQLPGHTRPSDLLAAISGAGGPVEFADLMRNRQRTSTRSGVLKAEAVRQAAEVLVRARVETPADLRALDAEDLGEVKRGWLGVHGQRSGISWRYLLMLAGVPEVKPDRMIVRFVAGALGTDPRALSSAEAAALVIRAAAALGAEPRDLDHRIWLVESRRLG